MRQALKWRHNMPKYCVNSFIFGSIAVEVEAANEDEALDRATDKIAINGLDVWNIDEQDVDLLTEEPDDDEVD